MRSARFYSDHKVTFCPTISRKGLTLVELLVAMAIIPIVLIAATTISLQAAQVAQTTDADTKAIAEMDNVMSTIARAIENGTLSKVDTNNVFYSTETSLITCPGSSESCYSLTVRIPNAPPKIFLYAPTSRVLQMCTAPDDNSICNSSDLINISYNKTIQMPETPQEPFEILPNASQVKINFRFFGHNDQALKSSQIVNLNGGNGIAP